MEEYFRRIKINKLAEKALGSVMAAWKATGISDMYKWQNVGKAEFPEDTRLGAISKKIHDEYMRISGIERKRLNIEQDRKKGKATFEDVDKLAEELVVEAEKAVANIKEYAKEI